MGTFARLSTALLAAVALVGASPNPAVAATNNPVEITAITPPPKVVINSLSCRNLPLTYQVDTAPGWEYWGAQVDVFRNGVQQDVAFVGDGLQPYFYCPLSDGLGRFTFGPSIIDAWGGASMDAASFADDTARSFSVKVKSTTTFTGTYRSGGRVTFVANTKRFYLGTGTTRAWSSSKVTVQRLRADGTWGYVTTLPYVARGKARRTVSASRGTFRFVAAGNGWIWQSESQAFYL